MQPAGAGRTQTPKPEHIQQHAFLVYKIAQHSKGAITEKSVVQPAVAGRIQTPPMTHSTAAFRKMGPDDHSLHSMIHEPSRISPGCSPPGLGAPRHRNQDTLNSMRLFVILHARLPICPAKGKSTRELAVTWDRRQEHRGKLRHNCGGQCCQVAHPLPQETGLGDIPVGRPPCDVLHHIRKSLAQDP